ncbi:MAG: hypothetical protein ACLFSB_15795 [Chitinispirillaceae bacterium]
MAKAPWHGISAPGFGFVNPVVEKKRAEETKKLAEQERELDEIYEQQEIIVSKKPEFFKNAGATPFRITRKTDPRSPIPATHLSCAASIITWSNELRSTR